MAKRILDQLSDRSDLAYLRLEMEVAFKRRDITAVQELCDRVKSDWERLDGESKAFLTYWLEGSQ